MKKPDGDDIAGGCLAGTAAALFALICFFAYLSEVRCKASILEPGKKCSAGANIVINSGIVMCVCEGEKK